MELDGPLRLELYNQWKRIIKDFQNVDYILQRPEMLTYHDM